MIKMLCSPAQSGTPGHPKMRSSFQRGRYLVVLQTGDHDLRQDDHPGAAHPRAAVHQHRQVGVLWVTDAVGVSPHRLDLLQVRCRNMRIATLSRYTINAYIQYKST